MNFLRIIVTDAPISDAKPHFIIGTPMYGGACTGLYMQSVLDLTTIISGQGLPIGSITITNESLITRARNAIVDSFLSIPSATHLLFIDADIGFEALDVVRMINADKDLIIAPAPMKTIDWESVGAAARRGEIDLEMNAGVFGVIGMPNQKIDASADVMEIHLGATAFMIIKRVVFERLMPYTKTYRDRKYDFSRQRCVYDFFRTTIDDETNCLLSEDFYFCESYRRIGGSVWLAPWVDLRHLGAYEYRGRYAVYHNREVEKFNAGDAGGAVGGA